MPLADYSAVVTLGHTCAVNFQLARAAATSGYPAHRCMGPFDWMSLDVPTAIRIIAADLKRYFDHDGIVLAPAQDLNDDFHLFDAHGVESRHQVSRDSDEPTPKPRAWFEFGKWLGARLQRWHESLADAEAKTLFLRFEDSTRPDDPGDIARLAELLESKARGHVRLVWIRLRPRELMRPHPRVSVLGVRPSWPEGLDPEQVDWMYDYGFGVAWRGRDEDWDAVWAAV